jgi:hypothetical protein
MGNNQEYGDVSEAKMTFQEMAQIVEEEREIAFLEREAEDRKWRAEQRAKAQVLISVLRRHLPAAILTEFEELFSTNYGSDCVYALLERDRKRLALLKERPEADKEEIDNFLDTGVWRSKDKLAGRRRDEQEAWDLRGEIPF